MSRPQLGFYAILLLFVAAFVVFAPKLLDRWIPKNDFYLVEPHTCALFQNTWDDAGFVGFSELPVRIRCHTVARLVTCTVEVESKVYTFEGTSAPLGDKTLISTLNRSDVRSHLELTCDAKGRCDFARSWDQELRIGFACLRDSAWQGNPDPDSKEL